ncbi:hypothetical protein EG347_08840 [Chryseobacterium sp. G0186]|uniref:hypothetical protein n=1 Tax=Chryseobacterium sp. G0186 TaxID=2487064 RepID=UPI000F4EF9EF|nr:hypothetical protein [Chryseobacterium sp. G0186]AZA77613.1 hypothetical protein EG347_08840 [Chryseobacterium sp. G0186]
MLFIKIYYYLFYKLYKFWEYVSVPKFWSDVKASLSIDLLVLFAVSSVFFYFDISFGDKTIFLACLILMLFVSNYFLLQESVWRKYIDYFEALPKNKNRNGSILVWSIILLILLSFIHSIYWMDQRARKNQTGPYSKEFISTEKD